MGDDAAVPGPYTQQAREEWLRKLLQAQTYIQQHGPPGVKERFALIRDEELQEIRRIWVMEKHELEDRLPALYTEATGREYAGPALGDDLMLGAAEMRDLADICGADRLHFELVRELLSITRQQQNAARRAGLNERIEQSLRKHFFDDRDDAVARAQARARARDDARQSANP